MTEERSCLDLMAGQPQNVDRHTGELIYGSLRRVLSAVHGFARHVFFELPDRAETAGEARVTMRRHGHQARPTGFRVTT